MNCYYYSLPSYDIPILCYLGGYLQYLPLKTRITLKSPLEGQKLDPYHNPQEFLARTVVNLSSSAEWEANVQGNLVNFTYF